MAKVRRELREGMSGLKNVWDAKIEHHLEEIELKAKQRNPFLGAAPHLVVLVFAAFVVWMAQPGSSLFSWHPTLMTLAFMVLMTEAVLLFSPWFSAIPGLARESTTLWHWVLQGCVMACAYTGLAVITYNKYLNNYSHYTSWHGTVGIIVCCLLAFQASGGIIVLYPTVLPFSLKKITLKRMHALSGTLVFCGAMTALVLGLYSAWFSGSVQHWLVWRACVACPPLLLFLVLLQFGRNFVRPFFKRY